MRYRPFRLKCPVISAKSRCFLVIILLLFGIWLLLSVLDKRIRPTAEQLALAELDNEVTGCVNRLCRQLTEENILCYDNLVTLTHDETGRVTELETSMEMMNNLRMAVGKGVSEVLDGQSRRSVKIPIGAVLNWSIFTTLGPEIPIELLHTGQVSVSFDSQFRSVGLDRTAHTIHMLVTVDVLLMMPGGISEQRLSCKIPLAEAMFVGEIPQNYTNIVYGDQYTGAVTDATAVQNETNQTKENRSWK